MNQTATETGPETKVVAERITAYQLERTLKDLQKLIDHVPLTLGNELAEACDGGIQDISGKIARTMDAVKTFEEVIDRKQDEIIKLVDELWSKIKESHQRTSERIKALPELPEIKYPYGLTKVVEIAEKMDRLSDKQWSRVIELAKALNEKEEPDA